MSTTNPADEHAREPSSGRRIVVLEGDAALRAALVEGLERNGYHMTTAKSGAEVLEALADLAPDLIVLDMLMPGMDGFEFLARLNADPRRARIPVVILSNVADALQDCIDPEAAKAIGVAAILPKAIPLSLVLDRISLLLSAERPPGSR